jgi:ABC-type oligopeptide transport system ATPase subunit
MSLLELSGLGKTYAGRGGGRVQALADVDLTVEAGEVVGVVGESG